jgi:hypothetical protein
LTYNEIIKQKLRWTNWDANDRMTGPDHGPEPYTEKRYHFDILGRIFDLLPRSIPRSHIEAYKIDTYDAAQRGETFSHRLSVISAAQHEEDQMVQVYPEARMVVAAALPFLIEE